MYDKFKDQPFTILALSDEGKSLVEKYVQTMKVPYPMAAGSQSSREYGVRGIPSAFLIDGEGQIVWQGHPARLTDDIIQKAIDDTLARRDQWDPGPRPDFLKKAVALAKKGSVGAAWSEAERLRKKHADQADAIDAFQKDLLARAAQRTDLGQAMAQEGRYFEATEFFKHQIEVYKGSPAAAEWTGLLKGWSKDRSVKEMVSLDKKRLEALEKARKGDRSGAKKALRKLKEKAAGLPIASAIDATIQKVNRL